VHFSEQSIKQIIQKISHQENIRFSYGNFQDLNKKKSIYFKDAKLKYILFRLFENTNIRYMSFSDQIILIEAEKYPGKKFIKGYIVDSETGHAIPYATVLFVNSGEGVISDYKGRFEIELNTNMIDTLKFSSLSYHSKKIITKKIIEKNAIKISLEKKITPLPGPDIKASDYKEDIIGNGGFTNAGALYLDTHGQEVALYIQNKKKIKGRIHQLDFKLSKKGNTDAPFRIRIYAQDSLGRPGEDILKDILVVKPNSKSAWFSVDISDYKIIVPQNGFFVSIGGVFPNDFEFYFKDDDFDNLTPDENPTELEDLSYGQRICYNRKSKNNTWHYSLSRHWFQLDKKRFNVMIKAKIYYKK
jgi:hypothetical protein